MKRLFIGTVFSSTLPALLACLLAAPLLNLWLHNSKFVQTGTAPLRLLLLAVAINSVYGCIYQIIVATGQSQRILQFNLASLAVASLVVAIMGTSAGVLLGGVIWLATTLTQLALGVCWYVVYRRQTAQANTKG